MRKRESERQRVDATLSLSLSSLARARTAHHTTTAATTTTTTTTTTHTHTHTHTHTYTHTQATPHNTPQHTLRARDKDSHKNEHNTTFLSYDTQSYASCSKPHTVPKPKPKRTCNAPTENALENTAPTKSVVTKCPKRLNPSSKNTHTPTPAPPSQPHRRQRLQHRSEPNAQNLPRLPRRSAQFIIIITMHTRTRTHTHTHTHQPKHTTLVTMHAQRRVTAVLCRENLLRIPVIQSYFPQCRQCVCRYIHINDGQEISVKEL